MNIARTRNQGGWDIAITRVKFCLDQFEKADDFEDELNWSSEIVRHCTIEEILGALVSAEQCLKDGSES